MEAAKLIALILSVTRVSESARILGAIPTPSYSHQVLFQPLWRELSLRGHQVTVLTTNPINDPTLTNLTEIDLSSSFKILDDKLLEIINSSQNVLKVMQLTIKTFHDVNDFQLQHPEVRSLIDDEDQHFDLLIVEYILSPMFYFSKRFRCPYIGLLPLDSSNINYRSFGHPAHPTLYPDMLMGIHGETSLLERVQLILFELFMVCIAPMVRGWEQEMAWNHFRDTTPVETIRAEISLLFVNSDPVLHYNRPLLPSVISIGGTLARIPTKPLEKNVREFLDGASQGFVYFSLGSNVKSKDIPARSMDVILATFRRLPYKVLWKYELSDLPNLPTNVFISQWVSQMEVLGHRNIKTFITHGGVHSMQEAIFSRVPMVGMPFFVDQPFNVKKMTHLGVALSVDYKTMTVEELESSILEVIDNPRYRNRIEELADLAEDQPTTGLERAMWWTEYVLRHKGAPHFRSPYLDIPWYQYYLVDVFGTVFLGVSFGIFVTVKIVSVSLRYIFGKSSKITKI
uniref:UDP-glucuronosyltransferase n=1 Tax=Photinus pyralis TaxID=7054 RepID=A0A1Y1M4S3_PHOPY